MSLDDIEMIVQKMSALSVSVGDWEVLAHFAAGKDLVVELGTNMGMTAIMLASVAKKVITIDLFENVDLIDNIEQREFYRKCFASNGHYFKKIKSKLEPFGVQVCQGLSYAVADQFDTKSVDMVFIDADHSREGVKRDYEAWFPKVKIGGLFAFHDVSPAFGVWGFYYDELRKDGSIELQPFEPIGKCSVKVFRRVV